MTDTKKCCFVLFVASSLAVHSTAFIVPTARSLPFRAPQLHIGPLYMSSAVDTDKVSASVSEDTEVTSSSSTNPTAMDAPYERQSPGERENEKFVCDETVEFWRNFQINGFESSEENLEKFSQVAARFAQNPESLDYFVRHGGRTAYFIANAILGNVGFRLHELLLQRENSESAFEYLMRDPAISTRLLLECALAYEQDWKRIQAGKYNKPYDMYERTRQSSPLYFGQQTARFVREAIGILGRRKRGTDGDKKVWFFDGEASPFYPDYYQTAFHYQTDGWMSQASADVYETSTETLFLGRQDAMQRLSLPPMVERSKEVRDRPMKVLEVAAGTGRFATFARDSLPLDTQFTVSDLSPFYLNAARDNDSNWRRVRGRIEREKGNRNVSIEPARFVQAKAEELPFLDEEFDAVVCVYLFHEIPREVRAQVASEMGRVVKPGGRVVLTDSYQLGDRPVFDTSLKNFQNMNEPHYVDYIQDDLPSHFMAAGLECLTKTVCANTKSLSFGKPAESKQ